MSIIEQIPSVTYKGNGTQTQFEFPFPILAEENLSVSIFNTIDKTTTELELGTDYDVVVENNEYPAENGYIIYMYKPTGEGLPAGLNLTIDRAVPYEQQSVYPPNTLLNPAQIEDDLDNLEMQIQQLKLKDGRLITIPPGYEGTTEDYLEEFWDAVQNGGEQALNAADRAEDAADRAEDAADEAEAWAKEQGLWEMDDNNDLFPIENTPITADDDWELDENGDIMPRGTVSSLQYPTHVRVVDVFSKLQGLNLKTGQLVMTQGLYEPADGGGASYVCVDEIGEDETADGYGIIALNNGKYLKLRYDGVLNVKWFGAKGNGVTDDTEAIQSAINYAGKENTGIYTGKNPIVFIPNGVFLISKTINIQSNFLTVRGCSNTINYDTQPNYKEIGGSVIKPKPTFNGNAVFSVYGEKNCFVYINIVCIDSKTDTRTVEGFHIQSNRNLFLRCFVYGATKGYNAKNCSECQFEFCTASYCLISGFAIGGDSRLVQCKANCTGIQLTDASGIMSTTEIFTSVDEEYAPTGEYYYLGAGVVLRDNAGNSNIIGGLFDWNRYGIICDKSNGLIVCGARFHHNSNGNITLRDSFGFNITGCKFLGGGILASRVLSAKSSIYISDTERKDYWCFGNISGNSFKFGDWTAQEHIPVSLDNATGGAKDCTIFISCLSDIELTISSNSMENSAVYSSIKVNDKSDAYTVIIFDSNGYDKPLNTVNNKDKVIFVINNFIRAYGRPKFVPPSVLTSNQIPTTKNSYSNDGYCWDEYKWINEKWIGVNQRKIPNYASNPSSFLGGNGDFGEADADFIYYNTTLLHFVKFNGSEWVDMTTGQTVN